MQAEQVPEASFQGTCSTFTVRNAKAADQYNAITMDENGRLVAYNADVVDNGDYAGETNIIKTEDGITYFAESFFRSAPCFDIIIDGITVGA